MHRSDLQAATGDWAQRHPLEKGVLAGGLLLVAIALPAPAGACVALTALGILRLRARVPVPVIARAAAAPLVLLLVTSLAVVPGVSMGPAGLRLETMDLAAGWRAWQRGAGGAMAMLLLVLTTRIPDLLRMLRMVGLPVAIGELGVAMYRMVWVLLDQQRRGALALTVRGSTLGWRARWRGVVLLAVSLLGQAMQRARRMAIGEAIRAPQGVLVGTPAHAACRARGIVASLAWSACPAVASLLAGWGP